LKKDAKVWIAGRSEEKASKAMETLKMETGNERVFFLNLDLADIPSCAAAAKELMSKETKLDMLFNNAYFSSSALVTIGELTTHKGYKKRSRAMNYIGYLAILLSPFVNCRAFMSSATSSLRENYFP
jgi:retinol dehydrogenase 12